MLEYGLNPEACYLVDSRKFDRSIGHSRHRGDNTANAPLQTSTQQFEIYGSIADELTYKMADTVGRTTPLVREKRESDLVSDTHSSNQLL